MLPEPLTMRRQSSTVGGAHRGQVGGGGRVRLGGQQDGLAARRVAALGRRAGRRRRRCRPASPACRAPGSRPAARRRTRPATCARSSPACARQSSTRVAPPWLTRTRPSCWRRRSASRTACRLTPKAAASSRSLGSAAPARVSAAHDRVAQPAEDVVGDRQRGARHERHAGSVAPRHINPSTGWTSRRIRRRPAGAYPCRGLGRAGGGQRAGRDDRGVAARCRAGRRRRLARSSW